MLNLEDDIKLHGKFMMTCKHCGHQFLPWRCFSMVTEETGWKNGYFCPNCHEINVF